MKIRNYKTGLFIFLVLALAGCVMQQQSVSTITGGEYNKEKDQTDYFVLPYGSVSIPGKWEKTRIAGHQQIFKNKDSVELLIGFAPCNKYEFNTNGALKGYKFVKAFYEWDSKYLVDKYGLERRVMESDSMNNYIVYRLFGKVGQVNLDTYFLLGEKNGNSSNFSITITDKWTEETKIAFLRNLFLVKKEE
jgi:hypothetical protein